MAHQADQPKTNEELQRENQKLAELLLEKNELLQEAQETLEAIRTGAVDGIVRSTAEGEQVFILKGSDQPYRNLIEEMNEGALLISESGNILYSNIGFAELVDAPLDRVMGTHISNWVSPRNVEVLTDIIASNRENGRRVFEIAFQNTKQQPIPTQVSISKIALDSINASALIITDLSKHMEEDVKHYTANLEKEITERKKAEDALRLSEERFSKAFNLSPFAVIMTRLSDGTYVDVNDTFLKMFEFSREEVIGHTANEIKIYAKPEGRAAYLAAFKNGHVSDFEVDLKTKTGKPIKALGFAEIINVNGQDLTFGTLIDVTERKKAEEALRENAEKLRQSEERFRVAQELSPDGFTILHPVRDKNGIIVDFTWVYENAAVARFNGTDPQKIIGERLLHLFPGHQGTPIMEAYLHVANTGEIRELESSYEGETISSLTWFRLVIVPLGGDIAVLAQNITERKKAEEALKDASEQTEFERKRLETILETSPSAVVIVNASSGKFSYANKRALKLYGFDTSGLDLDEHITKVKAKRMDGTDYPIDEMPVSQSLKLGQEVHDKEMILSRPDGQSFPVSVNAAPLRDTKGNITAAIVVFEDITQRKKAEKALRQAEERFRIALKNAPVSVAAQDLNHRYIWAYNQKTAKPDDIIGHTDREIFKPEEADYIDQIKERVLREGLELREQMWLERPSGRMYLDVTWSPLKDDTGKIVGITSATIDLTELKMAQEALKDRTERLEKTQKKLEENAVQLEEYANRMEELANERARKLQDSERMAAIGQVAGMVGHDIRNPLQSIVSELFLAKQSMKEVPKERTKEALESIDFIQEQIDYISKIVADLQDYSRPLKPEFRVVELCQFISDQIKKISIPDSVETSIFCEGQIPHIILDPTFMARILTNLVTNAIQAMPKGGKLAVTTSKQANNVLITVEDTGVGISDEVKSKMFTPLFTTKAKGQGFGLPVVKRLVEAQGGSISFESEVGKGTRFIVKLPLQK